MAPRQDALLVLDQLDPLLALGALTTEVASGLSSPLDIDVAKVCERIATTVAARLVTFRRIENETAFLVAGWCSTIDDLVALPLSVARQDELPRQPLHMDAPVYLLPEPAELPAGILDNPMSATLPRVVLPAVTDDVVRGYLHLTLDGTLTPDGPLVSALGVLSALLNQAYHLGARTADRSARARVDTVLRQTSVEFLELAPGEEPAAIEAAIGALGRSLGANHITYWDLDLASGSAFRSHRWTAPGADVPEILSDDPTADNAAAKVFEQLQRTAGIAKLKTDGVADVVIDVGRHEMLATIATPTRLGSNIRGATVVSRAVAKPWLPWEKDAIAAFGALIPQIRSRMATEAQVMASFYDAPVGITLQGDRGDLIDCNQAFLDFLGVDHERELIGGTQSELLASELITESMIKELLEPGAQGIRGLELPYRHRKGHVVWGRLSSSPVPAVNGISWLAHIEDITQLRSERERDRERATRDALTGLPNRHELIDTMVRGGDDPFTLMMLDLNGFKAVNDEHGHLIGDELLRTIGSRLCDRVRSGDTIGRFGGDEFVAILNGVHDESAIEAQVQRLRTCITTEVETSAGTLRVGVSIGVATRSPGESAEDVMARADAAMYVEKNGPVDPSAKIDA